jgi:hypothetical protein
VTGLLDGTGEIEPRFSLGGKAAEARRVVY